MKRRTIIGNLKGLVDNYDHVRTYMTGNTGEWVGLGLLTEAEYNAYLAGNAAEADVSKKARDAEDAVPRPNLLDDPRVPKEYRAIVERMAELKPLVDADKRTLDVLQGLRERGSFGRTSYWSAFGLSDLADRAIRAIRGADDNYGEEYRELDAAKDPKERTGTIVRRVRHEIFDAYETARKKARADATEVALKESPFAGGTNAELIERGNKVRRLVDQRQDEKRAVQAEAMKKVLEDALKGVPHEL